jgi:hypothetical protein
VQQNGQALNPTSTVTVTSNPDQSQSFWACFDDEVNRTSLQTISHLGNNFWARTFLSNTVGAVADIGHNLWQRNLGATAHSAWSAGSSSVILYRTKLVPNPVLITQVATINATATVTAGGIPVAQASVTATVTRLSPMLPVGTLLQGAASILEDVNAPKMAWDVGASVGSAIGCIGD